MENATKALLIAASVLIAIILIALGLRILGVIKPATDQVGKVSATLEISVFNSQFTKYEGAQKGSSVRSLIRLVQQNNLTGSDNEPKISIDMSSKFNISIDENGTNAEYNTAINKINVSETYNIQVSFGRDGYINKIEIK